MSERKIKILIILFIAIVLLNFVLSQLTLTENLKTL